MMESFRGRPVQTGLVRRAGSATHRSRGLPVESAHIAVERVFDREFGGLAGGGGEDRLAGSGVLAELVCMDDAGSEVLLEQDVSERFVGKIAARLDQGLRRCPRCRR